MRRPFTKLFEKHEHDPVSVVDGNKSVWTACRGCGVMLQRPLQIIIPAAVATTAADISDSVVYGGATPSRPRPHLFNAGEFTLHSGATADFKVDCDALTDDDIEALAFKINQLVGIRFADVVGIPRGGLRLAAALKPYCRFGAQRILVVDDVWTTGNSMRAERERLEKSTGWPTVGAVIFSRGRPTHDVFALWQLGGTNHFAQ